jgi:sigma-B regulation protein RsbQ
MTQAIARNNVKVSGAPNGRPMLFVHGFGCDQTIWRSVAPAFADDFATVLIDSVGAGGSDAAAFDPTKYSSLHGYARDVVEVARELGLEDAVVVGHSVGATIAALATIEAPELLTELVLISPSPRYTDDDGYAGGFSDEDIASLLDSLEGNYTSWSHAFAPTVMGNPDRPELGDELAAIFCRTDPAIAAHFARVTFTSDNRDDLPLVPSRALVLQCTDDALASEQVGEYVQAALPDGELVVLSATGHCPQLSAPAEVIAAMRSFLGRGQA